MLRSGKQPGGSHGWGWRCAQQTGTYINAAAGKRTQYRAGQMTEKSDTAKGQLRKQIDDKGIERIARRMCHAEMCSSHEKQAVIFQNNSARHSKHIKHERTNNRCGQCDSIAQGIKCSILGMHAIHCVPSSCSSGRSSVISRNVQRELIK